jgi:hypothetical protein
LVLLRLWSNVRIPQRHHRRKSQDHSDVKQRLEHPKRCAVKALPTNDTRCSDAVEDPLEGDAGSFKWYVEREVDAFRNLLEVKFEDVHHWLHPQSHFDCPSMSIYHPGRRKIPRQHNAEHQKNARRTRNIYWLSVSTCLVTASAGDVLARFNGPEKIPVGAGSLTALLLPLS